MVEKQDFDIIIVGGGLAGASLACALRDTGHSIAIIEAQVPREIAIDDINARSIALSYASKKIFSQLNIWPQLQSSTYPIKHIHISDKGHFGLTRIHADEQGVEALGFSIQAQWLAKILYDNISDYVTWFHNATVTSIDEENSVLSLRQKDNIISLSAKLIIVADGANSHLRKQLGIADETTDYGQSAIVANVEIEQAHHDTAFERFTKDGPIALLPITGNRMALVWTTTPERVIELMDLDEKSFLCQLSEAFGDRLGDFVNVTRRVTYPLNLVLSEKQTLKNIIILGNAAHALHPVAAQGFNLALRDVKLLAKLLIENEWDLDLFTTYQQQRDYDQKQTIKFTGDLLAIFSNQTWPVTPLRGLGLTILDNIPFLKKYIAKRAMGFRQPLVDYGN